MRRSIEPQPPSRRPTWVLDGLHATADGGAATIDFGDVARGLSLHRAAGACPSVDGAIELLGIDAMPKTATDAWHRGRDLIAVYETNDDRRLRVTAMWRMGDPLIVWPAEVDPWLLVISAQTSRAASIATLDVVSRVAARSFVRGAWSAEEQEIVWHRSTGSACVLVEDVGTTASLFLAVHPRDPAATEVDFDERLGLIRIACHLFPADVEKGVLLRSRVLALIGPRAMSQEWSRAAMREFNASAPILTS